MKIDRVYLPVAHPHADSNIRRHYPIEDASWVWMPHENKADEPVVLSFTLNVALEAAATLHVHISADERYELSINGKHVSSGPHRSDVAHWSFASFRIELPRGEYSFEAIVWRLGSIAPAAQVSSGGGGFVFACEERPDLNTGVGVWRVRRCRDRSFNIYTESFGQYHAAGPTETVNYAIRPELNVKPTSVKGPVIDNATGIQAPGWQCYPSSLPEMIRERRGLNRVRAAGEGERNLSQLIAKGDTTAVAMTAWQSLASEDRAQVIPPHKTAWALYDLDDYICGYPHLVVSGGEGASVQFEWAESLYETDDQAKASRNKGKRDAVIGKHFHGFGDEFLCDGSKNQACRSLWWRAGRFVLVRVETGEHALTLHDLAITETRYPLENESVWEADDKAFNRFLPIAVRGMQACSHESFIDCPFYEQLMYVGDGRLEMLVNYTMSADDRLPRRSIELFDWSRLHDGLVAERYPGQPFQLSVTFGMIWVLTVRDYAWWRDDPVWVEARMLGVRSLLEETLALRQPDGLLHHLPGWSFVDWVPQWPNGFDPPGTEGQPLSTVNLQLLLALRAASDLEGWHGDPELRSRYARLADALEHCILDAFWDDKVSLFRDAPNSQSFGEHAQCLAFLAGAVPDLTQPRFLQALLEHQELWRATVYFSFYLLETFYESKIGDALHDRLAFWKQLHAQGFKTPVEQPEPSRSDCHAWGAHPLFHAHASLAGVRPDAPGFRRVKIDPCPGPLRHIHSVMPHPLGSVSLDLRIADDGTCTADIAMPPQTPGEFHWAGVTYPLPAGTETRITTH